MSQEFGITNENNYEWESGILKWKILEKVKNKNLLCNLFCELFFGEKYFCFEQLFGDLL